MTSPQLADLFSGYYCVFVGSPSICIPYALFTSRNQAEIFYKDIAIKRTFNIMTVEEWSKQYAGNLEADTVIAMVKKLQGGGT